MLRLVISRAIQFVALALIVATVMFVLTRIVGDPVTLMLGQDAQPEIVAAMRERLGLDRPLLDQYFGFISGLFPRVTEDGIRYLDFGNSFSSPGPASEVVLDRLPNTLVLGGVAFGLAVPLSLVLATLAASLRHSRRALLVMVIAVIGQTIPHFVLAILLILVFGVWLGIVPTFGFASPASIVLPATTLMMWPLARFTRVLRTQLVEVMNEDFVITARSKGLSESTILRRHILPNALIPWLAVIGMDFGRILAGSIVVETVFAWPGIGNLLISSISQRDYPVLQATVFVIALLVILGNLLADVAYRFADPRVKLAN